MKQKRRYFRLVELILIVAAVVTIGGLIGEAMETEHKHKRKAMWDCESRINQIGKAFFQYAMSWDNWYPTTKKGLKANRGEWTGDAKAFDLLRSQDLLTDPRGYMCPGNQWYREQAENNKPLTPKNISYAWNEGLTGTASALSPICSDGLTNHTWGGNIVRGDGSTATCTRANWYKKENMKTAEDMTILFTKDGEGWKKLNP